MEENLQTEQFPELNKEQLEAVTGGVTTDTALTNLRKEQFLRDATADMNTHLKDSDGKSDAYKKRTSNMAGALQNQIKNNAQAGKTFEIGTSWANRLVK